MTNAVFGWPSYRRQASFSGGGWEAAHPVSQLGQLPLSRAAVSSSADPEDTRFVVTFDSTVSVRLLGLVGHNAGKGDTFSMRLYRDTARTTQVAAIEDELFWLRSWPKGSVPYGDPRWFSESYTTAEIESYPNRTRPIWLPRAYVVQAIEVDIDVTATGPAAFRLGAFAAGLGVEVDVQYDYGAQLGVEQRVRAIVGAGGVAHYTDDAEPRVWSGTFAHIPHAQAMALFFELRRQAGAGEPFLFLSNPDDPRTWLQEAFLAELDPAAPLRIERAYADRDAVPIALREVF